jgi:large subunit ribosomal protein L17
MVFSYLQNKEATAELFSTVADKIGGRPGGYTRVIKLGIRQGDNAEMGMIELVDFNEIYGKGKGEVKEGARRTRRGRGGKKGATGKAEEATEEVATATEAEEKGTAKTKKKAAK